MCRIFRVLFAVTLILTLFKRASVPCFAQIYTNNAVGSIFMSSDTKYIAFGRDDYYVNVWRLDPNSFVGAYDISKNSPGPKTPSLFVSSQDDRLIMAFADGSSEILSLQTGRLLSHRSGRDDWLPFTQLFGNGQMLALGTRGGQITFTDIASGKVTWSWRLPPTEKLTGAAVSSTGRLLAVEDEAGTLRLIDTETGQIFFSISGSIIRTYNSAFSNDENHFLYTALNLTQVRMWDSKSPHRYHFFVPGIDNASMAISPDGKLLAVSDQSDYVKIWSVRPDGSIGQCVYTLGQPPHVFDPDETTSCLRFSPDSRKLLLGKGNGDVKIWDFEGATITTLKGKGIFQE